jgi:hypothetical protein
MAPHEFISCVAVIRRPQLGLIRVSTWRKEEPVFAFGQLRRPKPRIDIQAPLYRRTAS